MAFRFDPRALIVSPYRECPACHQESFGVLSIGGTRYSRRCRECFSTEWLPLPTVTKKVVYIDQFAISNMMKVINVTMESHARAAADPFWLELFEALERVCKLQLVVCPDSGAHRDESLMVPYFAALKRMYEQLSHGVTFYDADAIAQAQINVALLAWLRNEEPVYDFDAERVTNGRINEWQDRLLITVEMKYPDDVVEGIRTFRDSLHAGAANAFEYYRQSGQRDFDYWVEHERQAGADAILKAAANYARRWQEMLESGESDFLRMYKARSRGYDIFRLIREVLERSGVDEKDLAGKVREFINSDTYKNVPANRINAMLWAVIAHRAAHGQRRPPNRGMFNDIDVVSTLMPFCDAMFIDRECAALLSNIPVQHCFEYATRIFSPANRDEFLAYLRDVEAHADPAVIAAIGEVYGETWTTPFLKMYEGRPAGDDRRPEPDQT